MERVLPGTTAQRCSPEEKKIASGTTIAYQRIRFLTVYKRKNLTYFKTIVVQSILSVISSIISDSSAVDELLSTSQSTSSSYELLPPRNKSKVTFIMT